MTAQTLWDFRFGGSTFIPELDSVRLGAQLLRTYQLMADGVWRTLDEISASTGDPPASVSARLRDLRKDRFKLTVERRRRGEAQRGIHEYRVLKPGKDVASQTRIQG